MSNENLYERNKNQKLVNKEYEDVILNKENYKDSKNVKPKIYNLSVQDLSNNLSNTVIDMINEFSLYTNDHNKKFNDYIRIITNEDRLIYVGIIFVIVSLIVFFIDVSR